MFTSWLLFYFTITVDGGVVGEDELEAVIAYSRYYLSSWLDRGITNPRKPQYNLSPNSDSKRVSPEYGYKPTHLLSHSTVTSCSLRSVRRSALSERVSSYEYAQSYGIRWSEVEANS
jgi:hypothetical protein